MLRHWSLSVWWCKGKLMLRLWNHKTKTVTVTRNLVLELKYNLPSRAGHWDLHLPDWVSYLPRAVGQSLLSYLGWLSLLHGFIGHLLYICVGAQSPVGFCELPHWESNLWLPNQGEHDQAGQVLWLQMSAQRKVCRTCKYPPLLAVLGNSLFDLFDKCCTEEGRIYKALNATEGEICFKFWHHSTTFLSWFWTLTVVVG